uniref:Uncharacterized protein n=1 Tax=Chromera velia CCMP2878 TaxID=1169474 RepID=A0A0G4FS58_9ALVE|eukprot:Cvel_18332.t1-p1 / transcript=Cvel_18332.t1 / gene=Cvel_18332 / organism=Chromera_velia_CCMP2878 / gene_product=hypothetical protein / transcript_product=hypothetical protein / location=Cvel_scaffold1513:36681-38141(-) / protein_length=487 / sequence_SO=supercontig / SO=protein_coding / is_pseudo=false
MNYLFTLICLLVGLPLVAGKLHGKEKGARQSMEQLALRCEEKEGKQSGKRAAPAAAAPIRGLPGGPSFPPEPNSQIPTAFHTAPHVPTAFHTAPHVPTAFHTAPHVPTAFHKAPHVPTAFHTAPHVPTTHTAPYAPTVRKLQTRPSPVTLSQTSPSGVSSLSAPPSTISRAPAPLPKVLPESAFPPNAPRVETADTKTWHAGRPASRAPLYVSVSVCPVVAERIAAATAKLRNQILGVSRTLREKPREYASSLAVCQWVLKLLKGTFPSAEEAAALRDKLESEPSLLREWLGKGGKSKLLRGAVRDLWRVSSGITPLPLPERFGGPVRFPQSLWSLECLHVFVSTAPDARFTQMERYLASHFALFAKVVVDRFALPPLALFPSVLSPQAEPLLQLVEEEEEGGGKKEVELIRSTSSHALRRIDSHVPTETTGAEGLSDEEEEAEGGGAWVCCPSADRHVREGEGEGKNEEREVFWDLEAGLGPSAVF